MRRSVLIGPLMLCSVLVINPANAASRGCTATWSDPKGDTVVTAAGSRPVAAPNDEGDLTRVSLTLTKKQIVVVATVVRLQTLPVTLPTNSGSPRGYGLGVFLLHGQTSDYFAGMEGMTNNSTFAASSFRTDPAHSTMTLIANRGDFPSDMYANTITVTTFVDSDVASYEAIARSNPDDVTDVATVTKPHIIDAFTCHPR